jgi:RNA recognition motif-containing protein
VRLYVGNLSYDIDQFGLENLFLELGIFPSNVDLKRDRYTGHSRGFGFVDIDDDASATRAIEQLNGKSVHGRSLTVNKARARESRRGKDFGERPDYFDWP